MSNEWTDLTDMASVATAQSKGWEIEEFYMGDWILWMQRGWTIGTKYHGRPVQPKKVTVKLLGWFDGEQLFWLRQGAEPQWPSKRVPSEDKTVEVEE
jgi:hypothetical protein